MPRLVRGIFCLSQTRAGMLQILFHPQIPYWSELAREGVGPETSQLTDTPQSRASALLQNHHTKKCPEPVGAFFDLLLSVGTLVGYRPPCLPSHAQPGSCNRIRCRTRRTEQHGYRCR